jgi:hypothetical protein
LVTGRQAPPERTTVRYGNTDELPAAAVQISALWRCIMGTVIYGKILSTCYVIAGFRSWHADARGRRMPKRQIEPVGWR